MPPTRGVISYLCPLAEMRPTRKLITKPQHCLINCISQTSRAFSWLLSSSVCLRRVSIRCASSTPDSTFVAPKKVNCEVDDHCFQINMRSVARPGVLGPESRAHLPPQG